MDETRKCPHCGKSIIAPMAWNTNVVVDGGRLSVVILTCPNCQTILGAVNAK
jgi:endogenous inhibitor of DNA gyrase (YacG/DUF329 family)